MNEPTALRDEDLPALYRAADKASLDAQQRFLQSLRVQLVLLVGAALAGAFTWRTDDKDWAGFVAAAAFVVAAFLRVDLLRTRPERTWYDGRAAAESVKTLAWRYATGGKPFPIDAKDNADQLFVQRLGDVLEDLTITLVPAAGADTQITAAMRQLRARDLPARMSAYEAGRVEDQRGWYAKKSKWNDERARGWNVAVLVLEIAGAVGALLKGIGVSDAHVAGIAGAAVAGAAAWLQAKQHQSLARAYSVAAQELASVKSLIGGVRGEEEWARFVDQAEEAVSREHTLWRASRTDRRR